MKTKTILKNDDFELIIDKRKKGELSIKIDGKIQPIDICAYDLLYDLIVEYECEEYKGFAILKNLLIDETNFGSYLELFKVSSNSTSVEVSGENCDLSNIVSHMEEYVGGVIDKYKKPKVFKYNNGVFTLGKSTFELKDLAKVETTNALKAENFDIEATVFNRSDGYITIGINGISERIDSYDHNVEYDFTTDKIIEYKTKKFTGFAIHHGGSLPHSISIYKLNFESKKVRRIRKLYICDLNITRDKIDIFSYDEKNEVFTINDKTFRIDDKINILTTRRYVIEVGRSGLNMYITINGKSKKIKLNECYYNLYVDLIIPYSSNKFEGFAIFNNGGGDYSYITIIKVKSDGELKVVGVYYLSDFGFCRKPTKFEYDEVNDLFTLDGVVYNMEILEKYKKE